MSHRQLVPLLVCFALGMGCAPSRRTNDETPVPSDSTTVLRVDNADFLDMTVYVLQGSQRVRLGIANGHAVTQLEIPPHLMRGVTSLRFLADPIGGSRAPVSDEIVVEPGDQVTLYIPSS